MGKIFLVLKSLIVLVVFGFGSIGHAQEQNPVDVGLMEVIWYQPVDTPRFSSFYSFFNRQDSTANFLADNFILEQPARIERITAFGRNVRQISIRELATIFSIRIFADDNGRPLGHPLDGNDSHIFALDVSTDNNSLQVMESYDSDEMNVIISLTELIGEPLVLESGVYWLCLYFDTRYLEYSWYWRYSGAKSYTAYYISPYGRLNQHAREWNALSGSYYNLAFRIEGMIYD